MSNKYPRPQPAPSKKSKQHPAHHTPAPPPQFVLSTGLSRKALLDKFMALFPKDSLALWLGDKVFYNRAFTPLITLWYMVIQHLRGDSTLASIIEDALDGAADRLSPKGKPLSKVLRSSATASWADARKRLPVSAVHQALRAGGQAIGSMVQNRQWHGMDPILLDGTTCRLRPYEDISREFPPHRGRKNSQPYWCLARAVVVFCMATGVVLDCAMGSTTLSEQALVLQMLMLSPWANALFVADRNFGVYSVVRGVVAAQAHALVRLTEVRAKKLAREANVRLAEGLDQVIQWRPTPHDKCPEKLSKKPVAGRLIALRVNPRGFRSFTLYLFTTLVDPLITAQEWAQFYGQRWQVELNLRYVKTQLNLHALECKSADMARKLWLAGLMAYNLVRAAMGAAAASANKSVLCLSFSRSLKALRTWLPKAGGKSAFKSWKRLLGRIARFILPKCKKSRPSEPRAIRDFRSEFPKLFGDRAKAREKLALASAKS